MKNVAKADDRRFIVDLELNSQLKMRVLSERALKGIFGGSIVPMNRCSNRREMRDPSGNLPPIDGEGWWAELVGGTLMYGAVLPETPQPTGKTNPHLAILDSSFGAWGPVSV
jgi:hypothetical protein